MRKIWIVIFVTFSLIIGGCTNVKHTPLSKTRSETLAHSKIVATAHDFPDFTAMTPGKVALGPLGVAAMISAGNKIIRENNVEDPALEIRERLMRKLIHARAVIPVAASRTSQGTKALKMHAARQPAADYILDVKTVDWALAYYPSEWTRYRVLYNVRLRLIDFKSSKVLAETLCHTTQGNDANPPTYDALVSARAALLKSYLLKGAQQCADLLAQEILLL